MDQPAGVPAGFERARAAPLRPAAAGIPVRSDTRDHLHVRPRTDRSTVPADWRAGAAPLADAPSERSDEDGEVHQDSDCITSSCSRTIWRNCAATPDGDGSLLDHVILLYGGGISNSDQAHSWPVADAAARRRCGDDQRRPSPRLSRGHAVDEPAADAAQQDGRSRGEARRQHGPIQRALRAILAGANRASAKATALPRPASSRRRPFDRGVNSCDVRLTRPCPNVRSPCRRRE